MGLRLVRIIAPMLLAAAWVAGCGGGSSSGDSNNTDQSRPSITYVTPSNNESDVAPNTNLAVTFNEPMSQPSLVTAITLVDTAGNVDVKLREVEFDASSNIATVSPEQSLLTQTPYRLRISTAAKDLAGNSIVVAYESTFVTAAVASGKQPTVLSFAPREGELDVGTNSAVAFAFSEPMEATSLERAFILSDGTSPPIIGTMNYIGQVGVFKPATPLLAATSYSATLTSDAKALTGYALVSKTWRFSTGAGPDLTAPKVISVVPARNAVNVSPSTVISATFDSAIYPFVFGLIDGFATPVLIDYTTNTVTLTPTVPLPSSTPFTTTITASDLAGNATTYSWNFTTGN